MRGPNKKVANKRPYKTPRKSREPKWDPLFDITYFETGKRKKCYSCPDLILISDVDYLLHLEESHGGQRMHCCICSECGKTFGSASELQQHTLSKCGTQARYTCKVCGKKLMSAGSLYTHMLLHGESNYTCNFCGKQFHNVHHLKAHERTHTKVPLYTCEVCGKGFAHRQSIITHSSLHTGIKPYSCEHCGKGFSCISNLLKHRKTHATTCGTLPLTSHRIVNAETKLRIRMNTPATAKQKNYSQFKLKELNDKRTVHAVRLLNKNKELLDNILSDNNQPIVEQIIEPKENECVAIKKKTSRTKLKNKKDLMKNKNALMKNKNAVLKNKIALTIPNVCEDGLEVKPIDLSLSESRNSLKETNYNADLKQDIEFDSDDSMPLSTFITSHKKEISEEVSSTNEIKREDLCNDESTSCNPADFALDCTNHDPDKLTIEYIDGFNENDLDDDDQGELKYANIEDNSFNNNIAELKNEENTSNFTTDRKENLTDLAEHENLMKIKMPQVKKSKKQKMSSKTNVDVDNTPNRSNDKRITRARQNAKTQSRKHLIIQNENVLHEIKDEIITDFENVSNEYKEEVKDEKTDVKVDIMPVIKTKLRIRINGYECTTCGIFFKSHLWLRKHQKGKGFQYNGKECAGGRRTKRNNEADVNYIIITKEIKDESQEDDSASLDNVPILSRMKQKIRFIKGRQQFMCKICGAILKYRKSMEKHQMGTGFKSEAGETCAGPSAARPQIADTNLEEISEKHNYPRYKEFVEIRKKNRKVQCDVCKKIFSGMYMLKKHQKNKFNKDHTGLGCATLGGQKVRKCDYCPLYLEKGLIMKEHKRLTHGDILTCDICQKVFSKPATLDYHRKGKHKLVPREDLPRRDYIYVCDKCGAQYKHKSSLIEHERTGCSSGPLFKCDRCDARLHNIYTLKTHMAKHVDEKKHLCTFCGMKFMMKVQLRNHLYRHTGEKPFKCTICPKAFAHSTSLDTHISTHTGIKRYICLACGKRFSCYGNLAKHKASKNCKEWYSLNGEKKKLRILDEKPTINTACNI